ncbi:hypothetical protein RD792_003379 [Penstemon davidsonii]|uniref:Protease Do-like PDZ domain-containing protein n=1 Tax=Penstemon davidsonii TaxID=160366 RepID=A0ABR0DTL5_9LAMI|nr:hypothetical protein RD792_003379 [Penstemon davidsonii]
MAIAAANCCFSAVTTTGSHRLFSTSRRTNNYAFSTVRQHSEDQNQIPIQGKSKKSSHNSAIEKFPQRSRDENPFSNADGRSSRNKTGRSQSTAFKSIGVQKKGNKGIEVDSKEQQVKARDLQNAAFLKAVVKVYCTHTAPDYSLPWQKQRHAFMIGDGKLLTNAHCVEHDTQVKVKRRGDDTKYVAKVLARGVECDIALISVESEEFWQGAEPLQFGRLPNLQDAVTVVGYPLGGETISVSKGVVSRIEVTSYAHGSSELLGIQIDAAINPGNSGGPAFNDKGECIGVAFQVYRSDDAENIGYVIPSTVVSHFLEDYKRNGKYTGFPSLGVLLQKLENPALRACLNVPSNEGVLVRKVEPTSHASNVLKEGDVIVSFDNVRVGSEGTVPFRSSERIAFRYLISQKFTGDVAELGIIRGGQLMKVQVVLNTRVHLVPYHIEGGQPSYLIVAGLVFTPLSEPLIDEECEGIGVISFSSLLSLTHKPLLCVILSSLFDYYHFFLWSVEIVDESTILYGKVQRRTNGDPIAACNEKYLVFEFEDNHLVVLEKELTLAQSTNILKGYGIPSERSEDLLVPYVDSIEQNEVSY